MKAITYVIRFEENLNLGDTEFYLKEIESPIRLEVGDVIGLSFTSFDKSPESDEDYRNELMESLIERSIYPLEFLASFEISDIIYSHDYSDDGIKFKGFITLRGEQL